MLTLGDRLMSEAQVMVSQGALKSYPTKVFKVTDLQAAFRTLSGPTPSTAVINLDSMDSKGKIPVSAMPSRGRASVLISMSVSPFGHDCLVRCRCFVSVDWMPGWLGSELHEM